MRWNLALEQFPEFKAEDMPPMPEGFIDNSWHNDTCPCAQRPIDGPYHLVLWVENPKESRREFAGNSRYALVLSAGDSNFCEVVIESDSWDDIILALSPMSLADTLRKRISGVWGVWKFCQGLAASDSMFHFDDSPETIFNMSTRERLFTDSQARLVQSRLDESYRLPYWSRDVCPIGFALTFIDKD